MKKALHTAKGWEISDDFFVFKNSIKPYKKKLKISVLTPKKRSYQANKSTQLYYIVFTFLIWPPFI